MRVARTLIACLALVAGIDRAGAYPTYTDTQCATCHPGFQGKGALHDVHQSAFTNNCNMCHPSGPGSKPVATASAGDATAFSCLGCHGRDYGPSIGIQAAGLRRHHANASPPVSCSPCHDSDPTPLGENILPPHYGRSDVSLDSSCDDLLDNDGDFAVDTADDDCTTAVEASSWSRIKALFHD